MDGDKVTVTDQPLVEVPEADWLVSYGYRHILKPDVLTVPAINIHMSVLPWNRGAHPNFWSWLDHTPKGVSIHRIDHGIDTGPVIAQRHVRFGYGETLRSSYERLRRASVDLFSKEWPWIRRSWCVATPQGEGTAHRVKDLDPWWPYLSSGWDTPVYEVESLRERAA